jgi:hypothetical protein
MVSLPSEFVLGEYWSSEKVEHRFGKLRARGVQICFGPGMVWHRGKSSFFGANALFLLSSPPHDEDEPGVVAT